MTGKARAGSGPAPGGAAAGVDPAATTIVLVRHGATDWNLEGRAQGQADVGLNDTGRRDARAAARRLSGLDVAAVYSSDLSRAADTAAAIAAVHGLEIVTDPDLREIDQGEWEGLTVDEIARRWPDLWGSARHYSKRPGGETPAEVERRALGAIGRIARRHPGATVVVVSHGVAIRRVSAAALGCSDEGAARLRGIANGAAVTFRASLRDGRLELSDFARLDGDAPALDDPNN